MRGPAIFLIASLAATPLCAAPPTTPPATQPALTPALEAALHQLSSQEFSTRERALADLERLLGQQTQALLSPADPESKARVASLLEFNEGLSAWVLQTLKLPEENRRKLLEFGLRPEMLPIVARLGSPVGTIRAEGVRELAAVSDPMVNEVLAPLLDDNDRSVYVAAMEVAWDRPPTDTLVNHLWERAVEAGFNIYAPQQNQQPEVMFRGQPLGPTFFDNAAYRRMQDSNVATDVLIHLNAPQITPKLIAFLHRVVKAYGSANLRDARIWMYGPNSLPMKNIYAMLKAYRSKETLPALFRLATAPLVQPFNGQINNMRYFWSNRTYPLALLLELTDQDPSEYKLSRLARPQGTWAFANQADEDAAIKKLQTWWENNPQAYPAEAENAGDAATTKPAEDESPETPQTIISQ
ncbi:MAG: hypothetical protein ACTHN5_09170 [Phycisphaerae bacterium]